MPSKNDLTESLRSSKSGNDFIPQGTLITYTTKRGRTKVDVGESLKANLVLNAHLYIAMALAGVVTYEAFMIIVTFMKKYGLNPTTMADILLAASPAAYIAAHKDTVPEQMAADLKLLWDQLRGPLAGKA